MEIKTLKITGFRSIKNTVTIKNLKQFNLFIGRNNSGKSNLIKIIPLFNDFIRAFNNLNGVFSLSYLSSLEISSLNEIFYGNDGLSSFILDVCLNFNEEDLKKIVTFKHVGSLMMSLSSEKSIFFKIDFRRHNNQIQFSILEMKMGDIEVFNKDKQFLLASNGINDPNSLQKFISGSNIPEELNYLRNFIRLIRQTYSDHFRIIRPVRKAGRRSEQNGNAIESEVDGSDVIRVINTLQTSGILYEKRKYKRINKFISSLLDMNLEISSDNKKIYIQNIDNDELYFSMDSWGTSLEELIILVIEIINYPDNSVVVIEEPELHLDTITQRKFINFLKETNHQFFVTSHSHIFINQFIDSQSSIYQITQKNNNTELRTHDQSSLNEIIYDLGIKASDILQTNGIIWVEGPSDRIYINKWIKLLDSSLVEGIHYSIMFYGGRLLSHLTINEDILSQEEENRKVDEFIKLIKINKNIVILIDSDCKDQNDSLNETKQRFLAEFSSVKVINNMIWVTKGREIENYLSARLLDSIHVTLGQFEKISEKYQDYDKVKNAKKFIESMDVTDIDVLDLKDKLKKMISVIKKWNN